MNVSLLLRRQARSTPDAIAWSGAQGATVTYAAFERTVDALARRLAALGIGEGTIAAVAVRDPYRHLAVALALGRVGAVHAHAGLPGALTDIALVDGDPPGNGCARVASVADAWPGDADVDARAAPFAAHAGGAALCMLCPTSGSTGVPKFVPVSHDLALRRIAARAHEVAGAIGGRGPGALRQACYIGMGSSYAFTSALLVLSSGGTVLEPDLNVDTMAGWLRTSGVNRIIASPIVLQKLAAVLPEPRVAGALETVEAGGGALPARLRALVARRLAPDIVVTYGLTECGRVAGAAVAALPDLPGAVGRPYPGVTVEIVDTEHRSVPAGTEGLIRVRGDRCATEYYGDPAATAAVFRDGWVYPGDRGVQERDGVLRVVGRADDVINRGGAKIDPRAIEAALLALGGIREVAVFGAADGAGMTSVCAAVVSDAPLDVSAFHARCRAALGARAPAFVMRIAELPLTPNGKVDRPALARMAVAASRARTPPRHAAGT